MEKMLFALEEKELEKVSGGSVKDSLIRFGNGVKELNKGIFVGDEGTDGFFAKRKAGVAKAWESMETTGVRTAVVANEIAVPVVGLGLAGTAGAYGVRKAKKFFSK